MPFLGPLMSWESKKFEIVRQGSALLLSAFRNKTTQGPANDVKLAT
jgi:hypothetical protein